MSSDFKFPGNAGDIGLALEHPSIKVIVTE